MIFEVYEHDNITKEKETQVMISSVHRYIDEKKGRIASE